MCVCSLSMKTPSNPSLLLGPEGSCPWSDQMARHSGRLPNQMTLNRLPGTREHTGHKIPEPFFNFLPLISACLHIARVRGSGIVPRVLGVPVCGIRGWGTLVLTLDSPLWVDGSQQAAKETLLLVGGGEAKSLSPFPPLLGCG